MALAMHIHRSLVCLAHPTCDPHMLLSRIFDPPNMSSGYIQALGDHVRVDDLTLVKGRQVIQGDSVGKENGHLEGQFHPTIVLSLELKHPRNGNVGPQAEPQNSIVWTLRGHVSM